MGKTLCHMALEYARIEPTEIRVAIYRSILVVPKPFRINDIQQQARLNGKPVSRSTITNTLILFMKRKMIRVSGDEKCKGRGRPVVLYELT